MRVVFDREPEEQPDPEWWVQSSFLPGDLGTPRPGRQGLLFELPPKPEKKRDDQPELF